METQCKDAADGTVLLANNSFVPLIPRLNRIDQLLKLLEEKQYSLSRRDFHAACNNKIDLAMENEGETCQMIKKISMSSAIEEIQHKGSLVDRIASLENRLLQLSMDMDVGNTSKSSSSTVQQLASETTTGKAVFEPKSNLRVKEDHENQMSMNNSSDNGHETCWEKKGHVGNNTSTRNKRKIRKKWLRLFQIRLTC